MPATITRPAALAESAGCFCSSSAFQQAQITYLLARLAGGSTNPTVLAYSARCWQCASPRALLANQAYLLAVLAGGSLDPATLMEQAACYCFSRDSMSSVRVKALADAVGITDPNTLANSAAGFTAAGFPHDAVQAHLLAGLAGGSTDPKTIGAAAIQFSGLTPQALQQMWTVLAMTWAGVPAVPPVTPTSVILSDGAGGFWLVLIDAAGNLGLQSDAGPATPDVILDDGFGGFWKLIADPTGQRGTESHAGPATVAPSAGGWTIIVDTAGNLGTTS